MFPTPSSAMTSPTDSSFITSPTTGSPTVTRFLDRAIGSPRSPSGRKSDCVAVIGSLNMDFVTTVSHVPAAGETLKAISFATGFGGKGANQAVACSRLSRGRAIDGKKRSSSDDASVKTSMVGVVGDDPWGFDMLKALKDEGVDTKHVRLAENETTGVANIVVEEKSGENRIMMCPNANYSFFGDRLVDLVPKDASVAVLQLEMPLPLVVHNIHKAKETGKYVILNPAPATTLPVETYRDIDCLIMNESETDILRNADSPLKFNGDDTSELKDIALSFFDKGVKSLVIITLGSQGVFYAQRNTLPNTTSTTPSSATFKAELGASGHLPALVVQVVDTTAAGDTFVGAIAIRVAEMGGKLPPSDARPIIEFANRAAAKTVEKKGAMAAIPFGDEVEE